MKMKKLVPVRTTTGAIAIAIVISLLQQFGVEINPDLQSAIVVVGSAALGRLFKPLYDPGDGA